MLLCNGLYVNVFYFYVFVCDFGLKSKGRLGEYGYVSKPKVPFWGWLPPHYGRFKRFFGCSPGYRGFDPQPCVMHGLLDIRKATVQFRRICFQASEMEMESFLFLGVSNQLKTLFSTPKNNRLFDCPGVFFFPGNLKESTKSHVAYLL